MAENLHALAAELHTQAAYAHVAAEFEHSTGDYMTAKQLDRNAWKHSVEAVKVSKSIAEKAPEPQQLLK